jgi:hypothetical protein
LTIAKALEDTTATYTGRKPENPDFLPLIRHVRAAAEAFSWQDLPKDGKRPGIRARTLKTIFLALVSIFEQEKGLTAPASYPQLVELTAHGRWTIKRALKALRLPGFAPFLLTVSPAPYVVRSRVDSRGKTRRYLPANSYTLHVKQGATMSPLCIHPHCGSRGGSQLHHLRDAFREKGLPRTRWLALQAIAGGKVKSAKELGKIVGCCVNTARGCFRDLQAEGLVQKGAKAWGLTRGSVVAKLDRIARRRGTAGALVRQQK